MYKSHNAHYQLDGPWQQMLYWYEFSKPKGYHGSVECKLVPYGSLY